MQGGLARGLILIAVMALIAFTAPGREMYRGVVDWASKRAEEWANDRAEEVQERDRERTRKLEQDEKDRPASSGCGSSQTFGSEVSEAEAIEIAAEFWQRKNVPCSGVSTEFFEDRGWWTVEFEARRGCQSFATVDANTGEALEGGGGCP